MKYLRNALLAGVFLLPSISHADVFQSQARQAPLSNNGQPIQLVPGEAIVAGPALASFTFLGTIAVTTVGSYTTGVLTTPADTPQVPVGSLITGAGVTTGTTVSNQIGTNTYQVVSTAGTIAAVTTAVTMTAQPKFTSVIVGTLGKTAPTYASGGCTGGSPAFVAGSTPYSWSFTNGSGTCTGGNTVTFTFPAAATSWQCGNLVSTLNGSTDVYVSTGSTSTTAVVLTDYSAAGAAQNTKANDVITGTCTPR